MLWHLLDREKMPVPKGGLFGKSSDSGKAGDCDLMPNIYGKTGFCTQLKVNRKDCMKEISESIANVSV